MAKRSNENVSLDGMKLGKDGYIRLLVEKNRWIHMKKIARLIDNEMACLVPNFFTSKK